MTRNQFLAHLRDGKLLVALANKLQVLLMLGRALHFFLLFFLQYVL